MYLSLNGTYMLMGQSKEAAAKKKSLGTGRSLRGHVNWLQAAVMMILAAVAPCGKAFHAFDCNNASAPVMQYSLLDPEPCGNMQKLHAVERYLQGEIVQIKKERLVQVTRCQVYETITSQYCGWHSRAGVVWYLKFRERITI
jgi:hypothetical protein